MQQKLFFKFLFLFLFFPSLVPAQKKWLRAIRPDEAQLQYAGSIGFVSVGAGYHFFKERTTLSAHYGFVPQSLGGDLSIVALKFQYRPWSIRLGEQIELLPLNPVFFPSYTLGENFDFKFEGSTYRKGYYFWSSALRLHLGASAEIRIKQPSTSSIKAYGIYTEWNTNDLYAISWFQNRTSTPFYKMFKVGYGLKAYF